jgi:hypothetical protein
MEYIMGCNCKNKNKTTQEQNPAPENTQQEQVSFRKEEIKKESGIKEKLTMMQSFATAIASRGISNEKVTIPMKQLRVASCFGNQNQGGILPPCEHLKQSQTPGKFFCGGCGCGDRKGTWLISEGDEYSKLDYPKLSCPLQMPGFSNYSKSKPDEANAPITRRYYIEQMAYKDIEKIPVKTHEAPITPPKEETK